MDDNATVANVRALLLEREPRLQPVMDRSVSALNRRYVSPETLLHEGDELVFIPPTGGGC
ncbi:hypothetical protein KDH_63490 [Dictyobacter sp. S3.2.2.5]|uniref:Molybdopterin synthase sulfur carrier subunit n=1 Tax=Dictyobacter halimunensis TaxID=3026934 RepID=A0ABQ6G0G2_9CHLR|nr:hypothetical protein KDH_63490 [Dictyobacter sp. S3.2.2.5]